MSQNQSVKHTVTITGRQATWLMFERICELEMRRPGVQLSQYLALMAGHTMPVHNLQGPCPEEPFWKELYRLQRIEEQLHKLFCGDEIRSAPTGIIPFPEKAKRDQILMMPHR